MPQPNLDVQPSERVLALRRKRQTQHQKSLRSARFQALGWELTGRLTVNLTLTLVALAALVKLLPYHQTQRQVLQELDGSIDTLETHNSRLRQDFTRYFDPAQTSQVLQENGTRDSDQRVPIVWVDKMPEQPRPNEINPDETVESEPATE